MTTNRLACFLLLSAAACASERETNNNQRNVNANAALPHGEYVEARTATVFAGECHYASERAELGREAVMAWRVGGGQFDGVSLAGAQAVAVVVADRNLELCEARRNSVVIVDAQNETQRNAMARWIQTQHSAALGNVREVRGEAIRFARVGDHFEVKSGSVELAGNALANRKCCTMPSELCYVPLAAMQQRVVGSADVFRQSLPALGRDFSVPADNCAFVGTF
jgi:hypothetical protein